MQSSLDEGKRPLARIFRYTLTAIMIIGLGMTIHSLYSYWVFEQSSFPDRLLHLWSRDLEAQRRQVPEFWSQLKEVKWSAGTKRAKEWKEKIAHRLPIKTNASGKYTLEIILLPWMDQGQMGASIQYSVIELESGNTVWESGRTYRLGEFQSPEILKRPKRKTKESTPEIQKERSTPKKEKAS